MRWVGPPPASADERTPARHMLHRAWLIAASALIAALLVWVLLRDNPKTYERTLTFVILPSASLEAGEIPDALRSLDQQNSQISGTMAAAVGSKAFLRAAAQQALRRPPGDGYESSAGVRPGSDALTVRLRGPSPAVLAAIAPVLSTKAVRWVDANMRSYRLQQLDSAPSEGPVAPKTFQLVVVAAFLAAMLALGAAYLEGRARWRRASVGSGVVVTLPEDDSRVVPYQPAARVERHQDAETRRHV